VEGGSSDVSDEEEIEEELGFISPLDTVNPYVTFKQALTSMCLSVLRVCVPVTDGSCWVALEVKDRVTYQAATTSLNVEQQTVLMEIMRMAEEAAGASASAP
jgi:hypothetical protein